MDPSEFPKVTPSLLARAHQTCPRRLRHEYEGRLGGTDTLFRGRVRDRFLDAARSSHATLATPDPAHFRVPGDLVPEEAAVFERCTQVYLELFGSEAVKVVPAGCDETTVHPRRRLRIGGWVDLTLETASGGKELRQFTFWAQTVPADPVAVPGIKVALLRAARWIGSDAVLVRYADLITGTSSERLVGFAVELDVLRDWFDGRVRLVEDRIATGAVVPGHDCGNCRYVAGCPAHPQALTRGAARSA